MKRFIARHQAQITGTLSGYDRMLFKGTLSGDSWRFLDQNSLPVARSTLTAESWAPSTQPKNKDGDRLVSVRGSGPG